MRRKRATRFFLIFIVPHVVFGILALISPAATLIDILNGAILALSCGVCVAYFPVLREIIAHFRRVDRADLLALGIFFAWFGIVLRTGWSLVWRYFGQPLDWIDTHFTSYVLFLAMCAAGFHLLAPGAIDSRVPTGEWVKVGALCALGVASMLLASWLLDSFPLAR